MPATACIGATWRFAIFRKAKAGSTSWSKREGRRAAGDFRARRLRGRRADQGVRRARAAQGGAGDRAKRLRARLGERRRRPDRRRRWRGLSRTEVRGEDASRAAPGDRPGHVGDRLPEAGAVLRLRIRYGARLRLPPVSAQLSEPGAPARRGIRLAAEPRHAGERPLLRRIGRSPGAGGLCRSRRGAGSTPAVVPDGALIAPAQSAAGACAGPEQEREVLAPRVEAQLAVAGVQRVAVENHHRASLAARQALQPAEQVDFLAGVELLVEAAQLPERSSFAEDETARRPARHPAYRVP